MCTEEWKAWNIPLFTFFFLIRFQQTTCLFWNIEAIYYLREKGFFLFCSRSEPYLSQFTFTQGICGQFCLSFLNYSINSKLTFITTYFELKNIFELKWVHITCVSENTLHSPVGIFWQIFNTLVPNKTY